MIDTVYSEIDFKGIVVRVYMGYHSHIHLAAWLLDPLTRPHRNFIIVENAFEFLNAERNFIHTMSLIYGEPISQKRYAVVQKAVFAGKGTKTQKFTTTSTTLFKGEINDEIFNSRSAEQIHTT